MDRSVDRRQIQNIRTHKSHKPVTVSKNIRIINSTLLFQLGNLKPRCTHINYVLFEFNKRFYQQQTHQYHNVMKFVRIELQKPD